MMVPLAGVRLCFVFLLGLSAARLCYKDTVKRVHDLLARVSTLMWLDCSLYTPTIADYQKCPGSTMKCFAAEAKVLIEEWNIPYKLNEKLDLIARSLRNQTESGCLQCELSEENTAEQFLTAVHSVLQAMNAQHCPKASPRRTFRRLHAS